MKNQVFVTGAGGFIGSHLVDLLLARDHHVKALVRYTSSAGWGHLERYRENPPSNLRVVLGDVTDEGFIDEQVRDCRAVLHLAALIGIPYSYTAPGAYVATNIGGTLNLLQAARRHGLTRFVHTSTSEVYGSALYTPIDEAHPLQGQSPYSATKIGADKLVESYCLSFELPAITIRPFNTFGPRQSTRAVIPTIISQALQGNEIKLGALDTVRDLTFCTDTAAGFLAALDAPEAALGATINLGTGKASTVGDVARMVIELLGGNHRIVLDPQRIRPAQSEVRELLSNNQLAARLIGWEPRISLRDGLQQTIDYLRQHPPRTLAYTV